MSGLPRLSARENLDFFATLEDVPRPDRPKRIRWALGMVGLHSDADTLVMSLPAACIKTAIARALRQGPSILLLGMSLRAASIRLLYAVWKLARGLPEQGKTVLLATHKLRSRQRGRFRCGIASRQSGGAATLFAVKVRSNCVLSIFTPPAKRKKKCFSRRAHEQSPLRLCDKLLAIVARFPHWHPLPLRLSDDGSGNRSRTGRVLLSSAPSAHHSA